MKFKKDTISLQGMKNWFSMNLEDIQEIRTNPYNPQVIQVIMRHNSCGEWIEDLSLITEMELLSHARLIRLPHLHGQYW